MTDRDVQALYLSAEQRWMQHWLTGPTLVGNPLRRGDPAPDVDLVDTSGNPINLARSWSDQPALVILWRHLGCGCGIERARLLDEELAGYRDAGLNVVVVAPGDWRRVSEYQDKYDVAAKMLVDSDYSTHQAFGLGHWSTEQVLYDAPDEYCDLTREIGEEFAKARREEGRPLVDDPWMQTAEFVVDRSGIIKVAYLYNYCEDFPDPRVFHTAARLAS